MISCFEPSKQIFRLTKQRLESYDWKFVASEGELSPSTLTLLIIFIPNKISINVLYLTY